MLHPRLPPLLRHLPHLNEIALTSEEEGSEERKTREAIGLTDLHSTSTRDTPGANATPNTPSGSETHVDGQKRSDKDVAPVSEPSKINHVPSSATVGPSTSSLPVVGSHEQAQALGEGLSRAGFDQRTNASSNDVDVRMGDGTVPLSTQAIPQDMIPERVVTNSTLTDTLTRDTTRSAVKFDDKPGAQESMIVDDDDDDDDDIVIPPLSMASDSESDG